MSLILLCLLGLAIFLLWHHFHWQAQEWPKEALQIPLYQAHRGFHQSEQENTLAAFRAAKAKGLSMIELDVRLSKDQVVVVFHDADLLRLSGDAAMVASLTAAELKQKAQVASLKEVLTDPQIPSLVNIEIKSKAVRQNALEKAVAEVIQETASEKRVLISSFNPLSLYRIGKFLPQVPRALLATQEDDPENKFYLKHLWLAPYINIHLLHLDHRFIRKQELQNYQKRGIPVALWTVNEAVLAKEYLQAGAVSVISDLLPQADSSL